MKADDALDAMLRHASGAPDGGYDLWVEACQQLADVIERSHAVLPEADRAVLLGAGALMCRQGFREMQAAGLADTFFKRV